MFFIEDKNFLNLEQKDFIEKSLLSPFFPLYLQKSATGNDKNTSLCHIAKIRPEIRKEGEEEFNSSYGKSLEYMLITFCKKNNIEFKESLRICVNYTYNNGAESCPIHKDHEIPHKQLLIYLNDPLDKQSKTVILDNDEKTILKEVYPEKYKGVCFENKPHYLHYPKIGERIVAVYTFI